MKKLLFAVTMIITFIVIETPFASPALNGIQQLPEPGSMLLLGVGIFLLAKMAEYSKEG